MLGSDTTWTKDGLEIYRKKRETKKLEKSKKHVDNMVSRSLLGIVNVKEKLCQAYRPSVNDHNIKVKKNREILSQIMDCILIW